MEVGDDRVDFPVNIFVSIVVTFVGKDFMAHKKFNFNRKGREATQRNAHEIIQKCELNL